MKTLLLSVGLLFVNTVLWAQGNMPYAEKAAAIQKDMWGSPSPEFKTTAAPAEFKDQSAVVLARSFSLQRNSNGKVKWMIITATVTSHTEKATAFHERVKLNDKAALEAFSTIEYQKKLDKSTHILLAKFTNTNNTYIGAKIIKPNGKEIIVNTGEEVLLKNETKDQQGKLAIPGLEIGDILDYYISNINVDESRGNDSFQDNDNLFVLADEYPVLYYNINMQFNKKSIVQTVYGNNAPHFQQSTNDAGDQLFSLQLHNLPKYENQLWTSALRQFPYVEIGSQYTNKFANLGPVEDPDISRFDNMKNAFEKFFIEGDGFDYYEQKVKKLFKSNKDYKAAPDDSLAKLLYNEWRFNTFCNYRLDDIQNLNDLNYRTIRSLVPVQNLAMQLTDMKIDYDIILVAPRTSNFLENAFVFDDFAMMIRINGEKPSYMAFDDVTTQFNEIPARFQGEKAIALIPERHSKVHWTFTEDNVTLPVMESDKNKSEEYLQVSLLPDNMQKLKIDRTVKETGVSKYNDQRSLLPVQTVDEQLGNAISADPFEKRLAKNLEGHKNVDGAIASFQEQAQNMSKAFTEEIKTQYDQEPDKVTNCKIVDPALGNTGQVFTFNESFVLNNLVKKAGDNYIIDAGKLTGGFYKLEDKDRKRDVDIYFTSAHSLKYTVAITIPQGYTAKGLEEITVNKSNKTGLFSSSATVNGNILTITINRVYAHNFEKAADWRLVTELVDAASNFNSQKILLAKKE